MHVLLWRNQWAALRCYESDGRLTIDNNVSERTLRLQATDRVEIDRVVGELRQFLARIEGRLEGSVGTVVAAGSQKTVRTSRDETP
jgi:Transposase IS66 family